jgi:hypothetical protein
MANYYERRYLNDVLPEITTGYTAVAILEGASYTSAAPVLRGANGTVVWSATLPAGWAISASTGVISVVAAAIHSVTSHTVTATDVNGNTATTTISITVTAP